MSESEAAWITSNNNNNNNIGDTDERKILDPTVDIDVSCAAVVLT